MKNATLGASGPCKSSARSHFHQATALDRELLELERRKMVTLRDGTVRLTRAGYLAIVKRWRRS